jgi:hypothetical protein
MDPRKKSMLFLFGCFNSMLVRYMAGRPGKKHDKIFAIDFIGERDMEMKMTVETAKKRAVELMYRGYH